MRGLRKNIKAILIVFVLMFVVLLGYIAYTVGVNGTRWFVSAYNPRLEKQTLNVVAGSIKDRGGVVLAHSNEEGDRLYIDDETAQLALCHAIGDPFGKATTGIERNYAKYLLGYNENIFERVYEAVTLQKRHGDDITTTLSLELSKYAYNQMGGYDGACVVMNYKTGEILASVSKPGFDLRTIKDFDAVNAQGSELLNRVTQGKYTPGSVFKTVTAAAVLRYKPALANSTFTCVGGREYDTGTVRCYNNAVHGKQTFAEAYAHSCNEAFTAMADELGRDSLLKMANNLGFNEKYMLAEMDMTTSSYDPAKEDSELNYAWSAVGQYKDLTTPMHMCLITAAVANDGVMMQPTMLLSAHNRLGVEYKTLSSKELDRPLSSEEAATLKEMMLLTVKSGTGTSASVSGFAVGGKTGTAETSDSKSVKPHSWFTGFIDDDECPLAIAIVLEKAGTGSSAATPAAGNILRRATELVKYAPEEED